MVMSGQRTHFSKLNYLEDWVSTYDIQVQGGADHDEAAAFADRMVAHAEPWTMDTTPGAIMIVPQGSPVRFPG